MLVLLRERDPLEPPLRVEHHLRSPGLTPSTHLQHNRILAFGLAVI